MIGGEKTVLKLTPSGILRPNVHCFLGNGVVIAPKVLLEEIEQLESKGLSVRHRLFLSADAPLCCLRTLLWTN